MLTLEENILLKNVINTLKKSICMSRLYDGPAIGSVLYEDDSLAIVYHGSFIIPNGIRFKLLIIKYDNGLMTRHIDVDIIEGQEIVLSSK